jgi:Tfp pilus assembly protein PilV
MMYRNKKFRQGLTLIELILASVIAVMISLIMGMLLYAEQKNWNSTYTRVNKGIEIDALQTMITFGINGRKSNKMNYRVYNNVGDQFTRVVPLSLPGAGQVLTGTAVEFRYWTENVPTPAIMNNTSNTADAYILMYFDRAGKRLMMDRGTYDYVGDIGGVIGNQRNSNAATQVVAENVENLKFSHTAKNDNGDGDGSIRMDITLVDHSTNRSITLKTASLMRNVWP